MFRRIKFLFFSFTWLKLSVVHTIFYCSRRELCCFTRECNSGLVFNFRHVLLLQCFPIFHVSRKVPKTGVVFVAAAGECLVKWSAWDSCLAAWERRYIVFISTLNPFMSWLILQNDWQFIHGLGKASSVLCKIGRVKSNHCCCEVWTEWRDETQNMMMATDTGGYPVFLFLFAGGYGCPNVAIFKNVYYAYSRPLCSYSRPLCAYSRITFYIQDFYSYSRIFIYIQEFLFIFKNFYSYSRFAFPVQEITGTSLLP